MARRDYRQKRFADVLVMGGKRLERLATMLSLIDWEPIERLLASIHGSARGAEGYRPQPRFRRA